MPLALYCCKLLALDAAAMVDAIAFEIVWIANVAASALPHPVPRDAFHPSRNPVFFFFGSAWDSKRVFLSRIFGRKPRAGF